MDRNNKPIITTEEEIRGRGRHLKRKSFLLTVSALVLVVALSGLAYAWYTRTSNAYSFTFEAADYNFAVNENVDELFKINLYSYSTVNNQTFAPGCYGWIPMYLSAYRSDVDVDYEITLKNRIPDRLRKHFRLFYYLADGVPLSAEALSANALSQNKITVDGKEYTKTFLDNTTAEIRGTVENGETVTLCIYWQWYWGAQAAADDSAPLVTADGYKKSNGTYAYSEGGKKAADYENEWNTVDTDVGRFPEQYADAFLLEMTVSGCQSATGVGSLPTDDGVDDSVAGDGE